MLFTHVLLVLLVWTKKENETHLFRGLGSLVHSHQGSNGSVQTYSNELH